MSVILKPEFEELLEPLGNNAAEFFMAASLYHAQKVSFSATAALANRPFEEFAFPLKEHFSTRLVVTDKPIEEDMAATNKYSSIFFTKVDR